MDTLTEGSTVGRYVLTRLIGEGGMGMVWAARHAVTNKLVALKMLKPEQAENEQIRERFFREAQAACAIKHPNIIDVHDVMELDTGVVMVMDLLEGESLGQKLDREGILGIEEFARLLLPVVSAVGAAHAAGIVHRDLKPDNIFLVKEPEGGTSIKVLDFGIAKVLATEDGAQTGNLTGTGAMLGTPYYMSPEQIFGEKDIDHRADVWALGVIFYECLSGTRPTQADNIGQILKIITRHDIKPLEKLLPTLPKDLTDLVNRMLSMDREQRPHSLLEVKAVLTRYADVAVRSFAEPARISRKSMPVPDDSSARVLVRTGDEVSPLAKTDLDGPPRTTAEDLETLSPSSAAAKSSGQVPTKPPARRGWLVAAAGLVAVVGVALFAMRATKESQKQPAVPSANPTSAPIVSIVTSEVASVAPANSTSAIASMPVATAKPSSTHVAKHPASASASSPAPKSSALPGGVVEKPPF